MLFSNNANNTHMCIFICGFFYFVLFVYLLFLQTVPLGLGDGQLFTWTDGLKRKDWHDYESIQKDAMRSGILKFRANLSGLFIFFIWFFFLLSQLKRIITVCICSMSQGLIIFWTEGSEQTQTSYFWKQLGENKNVFHATRYIMTAFRKWAKILTVFFMLKSVVIPLKK